MADPWTIIPPASGGGVFDKQVFDEFVFECGGWATLATADGTWTVIPPATGTWG